jgi:hypothetical protein
MAIATLLAIAGPFGTFEQGNFRDRFVYWFVVCVISLSVAFAGKFIILVYLGNFSLIAREVILCGVITVSFTPVLRVWTSFALPGMSGNPPSLVQMGGSVLLICLTLSILVHGIPMAMAAYAEEVETSPQVRLLRRLPDCFNGKILRLSAENHTVVVVTTQGEFRVRMRLADAIEEMAGVEGITTHRSHWIAREAAQGVMRDGARLVLVLQDGTQVPISRTYLPAVEEIGMPDVGIGT